MWLWKIEDSKAIMISDEIAAYLIESYGQNAEIVVNEFCMVVKPTKTILKQYLIKI